jgi:hypothetical protein
MARGPWRVIGNGAQNSSSVKGRTGVRQASSNLHMVCLSITPAARRPSAVSWIDANAWLRYCPVIALHLPIKSTTAQHVTPTNTAPVPISPVCTPGKSSPKPRPAPNAATQSPEVVSSRRPCVPCASRTGARMHRYPLLHQAQAAAPRYGQASGRADPQARPSCQIRCASPVIPASRSNHLTL